MGEEVHHNTRMLLDHMNEKVKSFVPSTEHPDDVYIAVSLTEAIDAAKQGNYGVGATLVDGDGEILAKGHNSIFYPYFRSDLHAEMVVLTNFEEQHRDIGRLTGLTLYISLEPCPMCLARLITSGISEVRYATPDEDSGMIDRLQDMPPTWIKLAQRQKFGLARCSTELRDLAHQIFQATVDSGDLRLEDRMS